MLNLRSVVLVQISLVHHTHCFISIHTRPYLLYNCVRNHTSFYGEFLSRQEPSIFLSGSSLASMSFVLLPSCRIHWISSSCCPFFVMLSVSISMPTFSFLLPWTTCFGLLIFVGRPCLPSHLKLHFICFSML